MPGLGEVIGLGVFGLFLGRFLNLTIDRLPPQSTSTERPFPTHSHYSLVMLAVVPVLSHLWWPVEKDVDFRLCEKPLPLSKADRGR